MCVRERACGGGGGGARKSRVRESREEKITDKTLRSDKSEIIDSFFPQTDVMVV